MKEENKREIAQLEKLLTDLSYGARVALHIEGFCGHWEVVLTTGVSPPFKWKRKVLAEDSLSSALFSVLQNAKGYYKELADEAAARDAAKDCQPEALADLVALLEKESFTEELRLKLREVFSKYEGEPYTGELLEALKRDAEGVLRGFFKGFLTEATNADNY